MTQRPLKSLRAGALPVLLAVFLPGTLLAGLFGPKGDSIPEKQKTILSQRDAMITELERLKPGMKAKLQKAAGYATFNQKKIAKAVSVVRAAQFLQVEHQMALFIDLNIASEMPAVGAAPTVPK